MKRKWLRWLYPGLRIKRWIGLVLLGIFSLAAGIAALGLAAWLALSGGGVPGGEIPEGSFFLVLALGAVLLSGFFIWYGVRGLFRSLVGGLLPYSVLTAGGWADKLYQQRFLERGPRIVVIGGGTGISVLLRGLKKYTSNLTAVVTVTDDGGSSGRLRAEMGVLPPGDIRNCLVALADTETLMDEVLSYRFRQGEGLAGHTLGNLLLVSLTEVAGSFVRAIQEVSKVLAVRGRVLPSTLSQVVLCAELADGTLVEGETSISREGCRGIKRVFLRPQTPLPVPETLEAIYQADAVVIGPGSLFTSVIPNLLVEGIAEAIRKSSATKIYICNVMTQPGETDGYSASDHLRAICAHCRPGMIEYMIVNKQEISRVQLERYQEKGAHPVKTDPAAMEELGVRVILADLLDESEWVRHDPDRLAKAVISLVQRRGINGGS